MTQDQLDNWQQVHQRFQEIWGYESFRSPQGEIIQCLLQSQDALTGINFSYFSLSCLNGKSSI